ncbi:AbrB family transcriptional regulator [Williamsia herbipolensis]|uniref:AbrB family transcriptional regulator n=1 Tax=Williamsia herbipolensis TaxID=1603258 RepID=UPI0009E2D7E9|nr:AbrB family transcriptional regulator [Williamsia herbipolensis]
MWRWLGLIVVTAAATVVLDELSVPSAALFAGLVVAAALALAGLAPRERHLSDGAGTKPPLPRPIGIAGQGVLGVYIGTMVQPSVLAGLADSWLPVIVIALGTLVLSVAGGALLGLHRRVDPLTGSLALVAGGASGLVALTRELGGDERMVAVVQYVRVGLVTVSLPIVATTVFGAHTGSATSTHSASAGDQLWGLLLCAGAMAVGITVGRLIRLPAAGLLGPLIVTVVAELTGVAGSAAVPVVLVTAGYAVIGWQAGLGFTQESLRATGRVLPHAVVLIVLIGVGSAGLGAALSVWTGESMFDGYLATTPGGIYAVLAAAAASGSNITFVLASQIVRVLLMLFVAPFAARLYNRWRLRRDNRRRLRGPGQPAPVPAADQPVYPRVS